MTIALLIIAMISVAQREGTFTDTSNGKIYLTVTIGTQTWMAENFSFETDGYDTLKKDGYAVNWETANKIAPSGWHLPSKEEWQILFDYLGKKPENVFDELYKNKCNFNAKFNHRHYDYSDKLLDKYTYSASLMNQDFYTFCCWTSTPVRKNKARAIFITKIEAILQQNPWHSKGFYVNFQREKRKSLFDVRLIKD